MPQPIFLHSSFRTSSTWLWTKFRERPEALAYHEIFNPTLATPHRRHLMRMSPTSWDSHHPDTAPYFLEFLPLHVKGQGVRHFSRDMVFGDFIPAGGVDGPLDERQHAYVSMLIEHAAAAGKVPVLADTRTLGRMRALARAFGGTSVLLHRNLFHQWASYTGQALKGNRYFIRDTLQATVAHSLHDPFVAELDARYRERTYAGDCPQTFSLFTALHLYLYGQALESADIVVDVNRLAADPACLAETSRNLGAAMGGPPLALGDCRTRVEAVILPADGRDRVQADITRRCEDILSGLTDPAAKAQLAALRDSCFEEWDRHAAGMRDSPDRSRPEPARPSAAGQLARWLRRLVPQR